MNRDETPQINSLELLSSLSITRRAIRSIKCLPFNLAFYKLISHKGLNAYEVFNNKNEFKSNKKKWFKNPNSIEAEFIWLIKIGILRREVDGQGLTSRVRLTPLGREILDKNQNILLTNANLIEKIRNKFLMTLNKI
tara:strand:+ start:554 stop:964 length:411 start_codon:yes stop_codon:yes gene_type:complete